MRPSALEVARYMLYLSYKSGDLITNLKLQKLLYYAQAWYLVKNNGEKLFDDEIEAWQYGPVIRSVYDAYKCFGRNPINDEAMSDKFDLPEKVQKHIARVLKEYMDYSASHLVNAIHQDMPWQDAYSKNEPIKTETMYDFYKTMFVNYSDLSKECDTPIEECSDSLT